MRKPYIGALVAGVTAVAVYCLLNEFQNRAIDLPDAMILGLVVFVVSFAYDKVAASTKV